MDQFLKPDRLPGICLIGGFTMKTVVRWYHIEALFVLLVCISALRADPVFSAEDMTEGAALNTETASKSYPLAPPEAYKDIPPGYTLFEGDIQIRIEDRNRYLQGLIFQTNFWTNGVIPYEFDAGVSQANRNAMVASMADWQVVANVNFRPRNGDGNYVYIQNSSGNNSALGMQGGKQIINIYNWNLEFVMAHELGHCLGLTHEHTRPSRDSFITINWSNIQSDYQNQFTINNLPEYGPYDFDSVMHYDQCAFSTDCAAGFTCACTNKVITVLPPNQSWQSKIGQRDHLSTLDSLGMSFLYPQGNWRFVDLNYTGGTENGLFLTPYKQFPSGYTNAPSGGVIWVQPGSYSATAGTYSKPITIKAPFGGVTLR
jgi:hypothetical protein